MQEFCSLFYKEDLGLSTIFVIEKICIIIAEEIDGVHPIYILDKEKN
ncbi:hypothetical protein P261_00316 [Lachnospiraceae bacterium TWA4]|nr:hypothetical protein P261_00316 [Lachnospiraceae bacterium TWA4]